MEVNEQNEDGSVFQVHKTITSDFFSRFAASLIDTGILILILFVCLFLDIEPIIAVIAMFSIFITMENSDWQATFGKKICELIVTDLNGQKISLFRSALRNFPKFLMFALFNNIWGIPIAVFIFISFLSAFFSKKRQSLLDMITKCIVIKSPVDEIKTEKNKLKTIGIIIGIILIFLVCFFSIAIPKFFSELNNEKERIVFLNMNVIETITEKYASENKSNYPVNLKVMINTARQKNYWKIFKNPFTYKTDIEHTIADFSAYDSAKDKDAYKGMVIYSGDECNIDNKNNQKNCLSYIIYGTDKNGELLKTEDNLLFLSNE